MLQYLRDKIQNFKNNLNILENELKTFSKEMKGFPQFCIKEIRTFKFKEFYELSKGYWRDPADRHIRVGIYFFTVSTIIFSFYEFYEKKYNPGRFPIPLRNAHLKNLFETNNLEANKAEIIDAAKKIVKCDKELSIFWELKFAPMIFRYKKFHDSRKIYYNTLEKSNPWYIPIDYDNFEINPDSLQLIHFDIYYTNIRYLNIKQLEELRDSAFENFENDPQQKNKYDSLKWKYLVAFSDSEWYHSKYIQSIETLTRAMNEYPECGENPYVRLKLAYRYVYTKNTTLGLPFTVNLAERLDPQSPSLLVTGTFYCLGCMLELGGNLKDALLCFQKSYRWSQNLQEDIFKEMDYNLTEFKKVYKKKLENQ